MPYDASWNFSRLENWTADKAAAIFVRADRMDTECDNYAAGLTSVGQKNTWANHVAFGAGAVVDTPTYSVVLAAETYTGTGLVAGVAGVGGSLLVNPSGTLTNALTGTFGQIRIPSTNSQTINANLNGVVGYLELDNTGVIGSGQNGLTGFALVGTTQTSNSSAAGQIIGVNGLGQYSGAGSFLGVNGAYFQGRVDSGTVGNVAGVAGQTNITGGTVTGRYESVVAFAPIHTGGTITGTVYGIRCGDHSGLTATGGVYNFYSTGATALNRFEGIVQIANGTAAIPSLTFAGDTDTGLFQPTANSMGFAAGGAEVMRVNSFGLSMGPNVATSVLRQYTTINQNANVYSYLANPNAGALALAGYAGQADSGGTIAYFEVTAQSAAVPAYGCWGPRDSALYVAFGDAIVMADGAGLKFRIAAGGPTEVANFDGTTGLTMAAGKPINIGASQVVSSRQTGWTAATGTATRTTFATGAVTLPVLAEHVKALIDDLITHGLIGA